MNPTGAFAIVLLFFGGISNAADIEVCKTCRISSVRQAIEISHSGDVLQIKAGTYRESGLHIAHSLSLIAEDGAEIVHDGDSGDAILITAPYSRIRGLKISGSGKSTFHDYAAIKVQNTSDCDIEKNEIMNSQYGIMIANSPRCRVLENKIQTLAVPVDLLGDAIHLWKSDAPRIVGNFLHGHRDGIYLEFVREGLIQKNKVSGNHRYGLHFMFSGENTFEDNIFTKNDAGVAVMYSRKIKMIRNEFSENQGAASFGMLLKDISDSEITKNSFLVNTVAIFMEGSNRNSFTQNTFDKNGWAIRLLSSCDSNTFRHNDFLNNILEIATNSEQSQNRFAENYWTHHKLVDLNRDGFADLPYQPTSFSSFLVEKYSLAVLLLGTPLLGLLDNLEKLIPALSPAALLDEKPLMSPSEKSND